VQELNLDTLLMIYNIPVILQNIELSHRDFHSLCSSPINSTMKFFLTSDMNFPCYINLPTVFSSSLLILLLFADSFNSLLRFSTK